MAELQCPNPECGERKIIVRTETFAVYRRQGCSWPLLSADWFWRTTFSCFLLFWIVLLTAAVVGLVIFNGWQSALPLIAILLAVLSAGLGFMSYFYLKDYYPAQKIKARIHQCAGCRYVWIHFVSSVDAIAEWAEGELARHRKRGDKLRIAGTLVTLCFIGIHRQDNQQVVSLAKECLTLSQKEGDGGNTAHALTYLGLAALYRGQYQQAASRFEESLTLYRKEKEWQGLSYALNNLGLAILYQGDHALAKPLFLESLTLKQKMGDEWALPWALEGLAGVSVLQQAPERAARLYGASQALRDRVESSLPLDKCPGFEQSVAASRTELGEVAFRAAWKEGYEMSSDEALGYALDTNGGCAPRLRNLVGSA
jgi:tetratricopeptide (TPR) repeat protein